MRETELEQLLLRRTIKPHAFDFSQRIILAAHAVEQKVPLTLRVWLHSLLAEFSPVRPVYALASVLLLGFAIGFTAFSPLAEDANSDDDTPSLQAYYDNGETL